MKKFRYNLESVLDYEQRILDDLKEQYAARERAVQEKQAEIRDLRAKRDALQDEFQHVKEQGAQIEKFLLYSNLIDREDKQIQLEKKRLVELEKKAEEKKQEVIAQNIDVNKFEKLKEKKKAEYHVLEQKDQESFIEEFVSHQAQAKGRTTA